MSHNLLYSKVPVQKFTAFAFSFVITLAFLVFPGEVLAKHAGLLWVDQPLIRAHIADRNGQILGRKLSSSVSAVNLQIESKQASVSVPTPQPTNTPAPLLTTPTRTQTLIQSGPTKNPLPSSEKTTTITSPDPKKTFMINAINDHRKAKGLSEVHMDSYTCDFAKVRTGELVSNFNHDGFRNMIDTNTLPYPSYSSITENIAMNSDYKDVVSQWINSSGHRENIEKDTPYVCVEYSGNYYAYEGWKP